MTSLVNNIRYQAFEVIQNFFLTYVLLLFNGKSENEIKWKTLQLKNVTGYLLDTCGHTFHTCALCVSFACPVASADVVAGCHHHAVGTVAAEVREGAHRSRVVTQDDL